MNPQQQLQKIEADGLLRQLTPRTENSSGLRILHGGQELWNFASNDYLGLSHHPAIIAAFTQGLGKFGAGATSSRLVTGTKPAHAELEETIARAKQTEAALTFTSGYAAALSAIPIIVGKGDFVIVDKLSHACLIDAARSSEATLRVFPHNDVEKLASILSSIREKDSSARILVITESIFSMDGDLCPLSEILETSELHGAELLLDEAHAIGILGENGMGLAEKLGVQDRIHFQMGTMSKALGLSGGYLAASRSWIDLIINRARPFIYTTAPPPALAHAATAAFELVQSTEGKKLRTKLFENIQLLCPTSQSAILPIIIGENEAALSAAKHLAENGFLVPAIRFPTVPRGTARLRITLSAAHPKEAILSLAKLI